MNRADYPADWAEISRRIRFERAGNRCEWCGAANGQPHPDTGSRVVLTVAHLRTATSKMDCRDEVLVALCQRDHFNYDRDHHLAKAAATRRRKREEAGQFPLDLLPRVLEDMSDWKAEQPHWCAVCGVPLAQEAVREGNDGAVLCPAHIDTIA
jgi:hypothetical protein